MSTVAIIIIAVIILLVLWVIGIYNNLVTLRNNRENAFANIDVQLKQRYDLIPQLVATVKGYAAHEKEVFEKVTEARTAAMSATKTPSTMPKRFNARLRFERFSSLRKSAVVKPSST